MTTYEQTRAGFVALALERSLRATPYVDEARALNATACKAGKPEDLLTMAELRGGLLTAAGVSDKAEAHLDEADKISAIEELIDKFLKPAGTKFAEELVYRFLLTRGDTLGGAMRNIGGVLAQHKFTRHMSAVLRLAGLEYEWLQVLGSRREWNQAAEDTSEVVECVKGLRWTANGRHRALLYNMYVQPVGSGVDLCLVDGEEVDGDTRPSKDPQRYVALGELKGGIDPAGADEHWKTASKALERIRSSFSGQGFQPAMFFIGAAIEKRMAKEIWEELEQGVLANAANLNDSDQVTSLCQWIMDL